jgi:hypothetical protein
VNFTHTSKPQAQVPQVPQEETKFKKKKKTPSPKLFSLHSTFGVCVCVCVYINKDPGPITHTMVTKRCGGKSSKITREPD